MNNFIQEFINKQKKQNLLRKLNPINFAPENNIIINNKRLIDFSSNDYLSLAQHPYLKQKSIEFIEKYGTSSSASRLLSGNYEYHVLLEEKIAKLKKKESGLIFGNGFIANTSLISALAQRDDVIFADKLVHASIIDGIILSRSKFFRFNHNDIQHLEDLLKKQRKNFKNALIITESVFSMDGDLAPLKDLVKLKELYDTFLYVDEAHATGVFGPDGAGLIDELRISDKVDVIMGTFGKALGSYGAYIAVSDILKQYLINKARGFVYSTALPASVIGASLAAIELLEKEPFRREQLISNSKYFKNNLIKAGIQVIGDSQILPVLISDTERTVKLSQQLIEAGFYILPIRPPTVPEGSSRLRISLTYNHSKVILDRLSGILIKYIKNENNKNR